MVFFGFLMKRTKPFLPCTPFPSKPPLPALLPLSLRTVSLATTLPPCNRSPLPAYWLSRRSMQGRAASQQVESLTHTTRHAHTHDSHTCTHNTGHTTHATHPQTLQHRHHATHTAQHRQHATHQTHNAHPTHTTQTTRTTPTARFLHLCLPTFV